MYLVSDQRVGRIVALPALDADALPQPLLPPSALGALNGPTALCLDRQGRLHIADGANGRVVSFAFATGAWTALGAGTLGSVTGVAADGGGRIFAADGVKLVRVDDPSGVGLVDLPLPSSARPLAVAVDSEGRLAVVDSASRAVLRGDAAGSSWTTYPLPANGSSSMPVAIAPYGAGGVLVADLGGRRIVAVDADGNAAVLFGTDEGLVSPVAAVEDPPGITVADAGAGWIRRFLPVGGRWIAADFVRGRRADGTWRFDRICGLAAGELS